MAEFLEFGHIISIHGFKGWIKCAIEKGFPVELIKSQNWTFLLIDGKPVPFFVDECKEVGLNLLSIKLKWIDDQAQSQNLVGIKLVSKDIDQLDTSTSNAFFGWTLLDKGQEVGQIAHVEDNDFQCLLFVERPNGEELVIPFHENLLLSKSGKDLNLDLPDGLLDL